VRVIGVVDLRNDRAVRAYAGQRDRYQPIDDAVDLARRYVEHYKLTELYVADLDAIEHGRAASRTIRRLADLGARLWLDAGISSVEGARQALDLGATHLVVGLETLPSFEALRSICAAVGRERAGFSLDLRNGTPIAGRGVSPHETPPQLATRAAEAGVGSILVIDLARVGTGAGVDLELLARVRQAAPDVALLAGGGVRGAKDLERLAGAGCDGALVATALDVLYASVTR
jgi:phosphoribosylformimino-5-aminoimidazole carboxamide ribotide isomerase